jgi:hypothetical protein
MKVSGQLDGPVALPHNIEVLRGNKIIVNIKVQCPIKVSFSVAYNFSLLFLIYVFLYTAYRLLSCVIYLVFIVC